MRSLVTTLTAVMLMVCGVAMGVTIDTVAVGNAGNAADTTGYGAVSYNYNIGKYEVTTAQYAGFLNAVAATDTFGLWDSAMAGAGGCQIIRSGSSGSYAYSITSGYENRPVTSVNFWDACRFVNWLHNGQPTGAQTYGTTEDGIYALNGVLNPTNTSVSRSSEWDYAIANQNEWYKAAYYNSATESYPYQYPTSSNSQPGTNYAPDTGNNANYGNIIGSTLDVGTFDNSASPYGTFDQGGNAWEWTEDIKPGDTTMRTERGGSYNMLVNYMYKQNSGSNLPHLTNISVGFRIVTVPEPATLALLGFGTVCLIVRRKSGRR